VNRVDELPDREPSPSGILNVSLVVPGSSMSIAALTAQMQLSDMDVFGGTYVGQPIIGPSDAWLEIVHALFLRTNPDIVVVSPGALTGEVGGMVLEICRSVAQHGVVSFVLAHQDDGDVEMARRLLGVADASDLECRAMSTFGNWVIMMQQQYHERERMRKAHWN
jgi:hypothetical protein